MSATSDTERKSGTQAGFLNGLSDLHQHNTEMLTRANEILSETTKAIWAGEVELIRLEAEEGAKLLFAARSASDPARNVSDAIQQWHDSSEKFISRVRNLSDEVRKCGWQLFDLYSESLKASSKAAADE